MLLGNSEFRVYRVGHDRGLGERLVKAALCFWDEHVMTGIPPQPTTRAEVLKLYPTEVAGLEVEADLFGMTVATKDFREGVDAFLNKRRAEFQGE